MHRRFVTVLAVVVLGLGLGSVVPVAQAAPIGQPGDLLTAKDITDQPDAVMKGAKRVIEITYVSEDSSGNLVPVKGSVSIPEKAPGRSGYRMMAWNHATIGLGDSCTLSDKLGEGGRRDSWVGSWLRDGYVLAATDYAGIGGPGEHAYLDGEVAGKNVLDMIRATRTVVSRYSPYETSDSFVSFGGSQGGHTSLWAGALAETYAPELKVAGTIAHSVPSGLDQYFAAIRPGVPPVAIPDYVTYFSYVLNGLRQVRPDAKVDSYLTPQGKRIVDAASTRCYAEQNAATKGVTVGSLVSRPLADGPLIPALREYARVPVKGYNAPILLEQGTRDVVAFTPLTNELVDEMRANNVDVTYRTYPEGHGLSIARSHDARRWANALKTWPAN